MFACIFAGQYDHLRDSPIIPAGRCVQPENLQGDEDRRRDVASRCVH